MSFNQLHNQSTPLLLCNVWDVASAKAAEKSGFQAIGTSSGAIATMLGYRDGEEMSFEELEYIVGRIAACVPLPLSVDLEAGYSIKPKEIADHIERLAKLGIVGINLEDSVVNEQRELLAASVFAKILKQVCEELASREVEVFINIRTDTFLLGLEQALEESIRRAKIYEAAGAHGLFVPCIEKEADIKSLAEKIALPLNVMCMPDLPDFEILHNLGVKRISMGNFLHHSMLKHAEQMLENILSSNSFKPLFAQ